MRHTLGTAAKATGKSRTTILRAIEKGKISAEKNNHNQWQIDPAELHRLYPAKEQANSNKGTEKEQHATDTNTRLTIENNGLKSDLKAAQYLVTELKEERDEWREEAKGVRLALVDQREKPKARWAKEPIFTVRDIWLVVGCLAVFIWMMLLHYGKI